MEYSRALVGKRLKELRNDLEFTQSYVAQILGIEQTTLSNIEKGRTAGFDVFLDLLNFYGKYHKVSNILLPEFVIMKNNELSYIDEIQSKVVKEIEECEQYLSTKLLNIKLIAGGVNNES